MLIALTHSIVDGALARLPDPEINLATFAIAKSLVNVTKAPDLMSTQVFLAFAHDRESFQLLRRFVWLVIVGVFLLLVLLGYTPLGGLVLRQVFNIHDPVQLDRAFRALRIMALLPFVETLRNFYQGMTIALVRTGIMAVATSLRVVGLFFFLSWVVARQLFPGIVAASIAWVSGIGFEFVIILGYIILSFGSIQRAVTELPPKPRESLSLGRIWSFFVPLGLMSTVAALIPPVIQAGISRFSLTPAEHIAAYGIALSLMTTITGPIRILHQTLFVYGGEDRRLVRRFCLSVGFLTSLVTLTLAATPLGQFVIGRVIGVSGSLTDTARSVLAVFAFYPVAAAWREYCWGIIMSNGSTGIIGRAKTANLGAAASALLASLALSVQPAIAGAIAYTSGEIVESLVIWHHAQTTKSALPIPVKATQTPTGSG